MNAKEASRLIGKFGLYSHRELAGMRFMVIVEDVRSTFGRTELFVKPDSGDGKRWVRLENVQLTASK